MAWMIDGDVLTERLRGWLESPHGENAYNSGYDDAIRHVLDVIEHMPTLTQPNEPLTLISMSDELPPNNERVLVYRPCMVDSDIGPYSVQWGWAAKRDGSHWARLPGRRPPEGEEEEKHVIEITENL